MKLELDLRSDQVASGEPVAGHVVVREGGPSRTLVLTLGFHERTTGYSTTPYAASTVLHEGELASGQTIDFSVALPAEAPPSVKAEHSELLWELVLSSDRPGLDTRVVRRIEVVAR